MLKDGKLYEYHQRHFGSKRPWATMEHYCTGIRLLETKQQFGLFAQLTRVPSANMAVHPDYGPVVSIPKFSAVLEGSMGQKIITNIPLSNKSEILVV